MNDDSAAGAQGATTTDENAQVSTGAPTRTRRRTDPFRRLAELEALIEIENQKIAAFARNAVGERKVALGRALMQRAASGDEPARAMIAALLSSQIVKRCRYSFHPQCWKPGWPVALPSDWGFPDEE